MFQLKQDYLFWRLIGQINKSTNFNEKLLERFIIYCQFLEYLQQLEQYQFVMIIIKIKKNKLMIGPILRNVKTSLKFIEN